jgi:NADPH-dependent 2,4-dienoyl-CoA reductase/sulfur reductase-like enzyme
VELIDMITKLAQDLNPSRRRFMLERMSLLPINYHLGKKVTGIDLPEVRILNEDGVSDLIGDIDALVVCAGRRPVDDLMKLRNVSGDQICKYRGFQKSRPCIKRNT